MIDFNGKAVPLDGVSMLILQVGLISRITLFVVIQSKFSFNALLGRDWIYGVRAIPLTLH